MADDRDVLIRLRAVMARELETINEYEQYADATEDPEIKALFQHLADEEKEHVTEVYEILKQRDAVQAEWEKGAHVQAIREGAFGNAIAQGVPKHGPDAAPTVAAPVSEPVPSPVSPPPPAVPPATVVRLPAAPAPAPRPQTPTSTITVGSLYGMPQG